MSAHLVGTSRILRQMNPFSAILATDRTVYISTKGGNRPIKNSVSAIPMETSDHTWAESTPLEMRD